MKTKLPQHQHLLPLLWTALTAIILFWLLHARGFDDPYITYRYATNLAHGHGFVYNPGERTLSTTAPFYAVILAGADTVGFDVPLTSNVLGCLGLALGGLAFWRLGQEWQTRWVGLAGLVLFPSAPLLLPTLGAETILHTTVILFGFVAYARAHYYRLAVLMALATLIRADAVLAVACMSIHGVLYRRATLPWRAVILYGLLLVPWFLFAWLYFGAPLPVTLAAKQHQGTMAISTGFFTGLLDVLGGYGRAPFYGLHIAAGTVGLIYGFARAHPWLILVGWNLLYVVAYTALGVPSYFWYYGPLAVGNVVLVALGLGVLSAWTNTRMRPLYGAGVMTIALVALLLPHVYALVSLSRTNDTRLAIYQEVGLWLQDATPQDASIGTLEVGIIGYYADRRMIDFAGLVQPETAIQLTPTATYQDAALWSFRYLQPNYLVLHQGIFPELERDPAFQQQCRALRQFQDSVYSQTLVVYTCAEGDVSPESVKPPDIPLSSRALPLVVLLQHEAGDGIESL